MNFDTVIHSGTIATADFGTKGDIGIKDGRIAALAERIEGGDRRIDAGGRLVMPGGIEAHAHIAQESSSGVMGRTTTCRGRSRRRSAAIPASSPSPPSTAASRWTTWSPPTMPAPPGR